MPNTNQRWIEESQKRIDNNHACQERMNLFLGVHANPDAAARGNDVLQNTDVDVPGVDPDMLEAVVLGAMFDSEILKHLPPTNGIPHEEYFMMNVFKEANSRDTRYQLLMAEARMNAKKALENMQNHNDSSMVERYAKNVMNYLHTEGLTHEVANTPETQTFFRFYEMMQKLHTREPFSKYPLTENETAKLNEKVFLSKTLNDVNKYLQMMGEDVPAPNSGIRKEMLLEIMARCSMIQMRTSQTDALDQAVDEMQVKLMSDAEFATTIENKYKAEYAQPHPEIVNMRTKSQFSNYQGEAGGEIMGAKDKVNAQVPSFQTYMLADEKRQDEYINRIKGVIEQSDLYQKLLATEDSDELYNTLSDMITTGKEIQVKGADGKEHPITMDDLVRTDEEKQIADSYNRQKVEVFKQGEDGYRKNIEGKCRDKMNGYWNQTLNNNVNEAERPENLLQQYISDHSAEMPGLQDALNIDDVGNEIHGPLGTTFLSEGAYVYRQDADMQYHKFTLHFDENKKVSFQHEKVDYLDNSSVHYNENYYIYERNGETADRKLAAIDNTQDSAEVKAVKKLEVLAGLAAVDRSGTGEYSRFKSAVAELKTALSSYDGKGKIAIRNTVNNCRKCLDEMSAKNPYDPAGRRFDSFLKQDLMKIKGMDAILQENPELDEQIRVMEQAKVGASKKQSMIEATDTYFGAYMNYVAEKAGVNLNDHSAVADYYSKHADELYDKCFDPDVVNKFKELKEVKDPGVYMDFLYPDGAKRPEPFDQATIEQRKQVSAEAGTALMKAYVGQKIATRAAINTERAITNRAVVTFMDTSGTAEARAFNRKLYELATSNEIENRKAAAEMMLDKLATYDIKEFDPKDDSLLTSGEAKAGKLIDFMLKAQDAEKLFDFASSNGVNLNSPKYSELKKNASIYQNFGTIWAGKVQMITDGFYPYVDVKQINADMLTAEQPEIVASEMKMRMADFATKKDESLMNSPLSRMISDLSFFVANNSEQNSRDLVQDDVAFDERIRNSRLHGFVTASLDPADKKLMQFADALKSNVKKTLGFKTSNSPLYTAVIDAIDDYRLADPFNKLAACKKLHHACKEYIENRDAGYDRTKMVREIEQYVKNNLADVAKTQAKQALEGTADLMMQSYISSLNKRKAELAQEGKVDANIDGLLTNLKQDKLYQAVYRMVQKTDNCIVLAANPTTFKDQGFFSKMTVKAMVEVGALAEEGEVNYQEALRQEVKQGENKELEQNQANLNQGPIA